MAPSWFWPSRYDLKILLNYPYRGKNFLGFFTWLLGQWMDMLLKEKSCTSKWKKFFFWFISSLLKQPPDTIYFLNKCQCPSTVSHEAVEVKPGCTSSSRAHHVGITMTPFWHHTPSVEIVWGIFFINYTQTQILWMHFWFVTLKTSWNQ